MSGVNIIYFFTNNDLFSVLKLPPLSVLSLFSLLGLKSMQPFSISEPRWNKISVILSKWYYQIHKYNYTNTKIQVDKYKFTNKSQWNHTVFWSQGEKNQCNFGTLVLCCFSFQLTNTFDTRWGFPAPRGSSWKGVTSPPAEMMVVKLIVGWIIIIFIANIHPFLNLKYIWKLFGTLGSDIKNWLFDFPFEIESLP